MWARQLSTKNSFSQNKPFSFAPKTISLPKNFSTLRSSYFTYKGRNYASINVLCQPNKFLNQNMHQFRMYSTPQGEPEPVVVHVKETKEEADVLSRTSWVYGFSGFLIVLGVAVGLLFDLVGNSFPEEREENLKNSDEVVEGLQFLRLLPLKWMADQMAEYSRKDLTPDQIQKKVERYAKLYNVDFVGLEKENVRDFKTFEEFFTRKY